MSVIVVSSQERPGYLSSFKSWKKNIDYRDKSVDEPVKDLALDALLLFKAYLKIIINWRDCSNAKSLSKFVARDKGIGFGTAPMT